MFREQVEVMDAVTAVYLCEVSTKPDILRKKLVDPIKEYKEVITEMLEKLQLFDILKQEKLLLENNFSEY